MKLSFITILAFCTRLCFAQTHSGIPMFTEDMLSNPKKYTKKFEEIFAYNEIGTFNKKPNSGKVVLENGYALSKIKNPELWKKIRKEKTVKEIDIVFTKYPRTKKKWIINYDELLACRLKELFTIDPALNNSDIRWHLLLQTDCRNDKETRSFFHGIVIYSDETEKISKSNDKNLISEKSKSITKSSQKENSQNDSLIIVSSTKNRYTFEDDQEYYQNNSFLGRPNSSISKKKKLKMPGCPDFRKKKLGIF